MLIFGTKNRGLNRDENFYYYFFFKRLHIMVLIYIRTWLQMYLLGSLAVFSYTCLFIRIENIKYRDSESYTIYILTNEIWNLFLKATGYCVVYALGPSSLNVITTRSVYFYLRSNLFEKNNYLTFFYRRI